jgi:hypothetical protein
MFYQVHDATRNETFSTDDEDNAHRFFGSRTKLHPSHLLQLWAVDSDGGTWIIRQYGR